VVFVLYSIADVARAATAHIRSLKGYSSDDAAKPGVLVLGSNTSTRGEPSGHSSSHSVGFRRYGLQNLLTGNSSGSEENGNGKRVRLTCSSRTFLQIPSGGGQIVPRPEVIRASSCRIRRTRTTCAPRPRWSPADRLPDGLVDPVLSGP
jgi:hypothetical protein